MDTYLIHHGIKGQKWGVRRFQTKTGRLTSAGEKRYNNEMSKAKKSRVMASMNEHAAKSGSNKIIKKMNQINANYYNKQADKHVSKANKINASTKAKIDKVTKKEAIKNTYKDIQKNASKKDKFMYNNATRKLAAKYVVNNKMTLEEANKKAKSTANRNTAIFVALYAGNMAYNIYKSR